MLSGFPQGNIDPDVQIRVYVAASRGIREDAIISAADRFMRGKVKDQNRSFAPSSAEFACECEREAERLALLENYRPRIAPPQDDFRATPEHRQKMRHLFELLKRARAGDIMAQQELRPHGWPVRDNEAAE